MKGRQFQRQLAGRRGAVEQQFQQISQFDKETTEAEKQLEGYLKTDQGRLEYARQYGIQPKKIYGKLGRGYSVELLGYEYATPYGVVTDWSPKNELIKDQQKLDRITGERIADMGFTSEKKFLEAVGKGELTETQVKAGGYNPKALSSKYGVEFKKLSSTSAVPEVNLMSQQAVVTGNNTLQINPRTGKPYGTVTVAPTVGEQYKKYTANNNYVKGTLSFLSDKIKSKVVDYQLDSGSGYGAYSIGTLAGATPYASYFIPGVGGGLMVAGGTEDYIDLAKRGDSSRVGQMKESFTGFGKNVGLSENQSKFLGYTAYAVPAGEIALGAFALRGDFKNIQSSQQNKLLKNTNTEVKGVRFEGNKGGYDVIYGYQKTNPNWIQRNILRIQPTETLTKVRQPFIKTNNNRIILEQGQGITFSKTGDTLRASTFTQTGQYNILDDSVSYFKGGVGYKIPNAQGGIGSIKTTTKNIAELKITRGYDLIGDKFIVRASGSTIRGGGSTTKPFIGFGVETSDDVLRVVGGSPTKARFNLVTGQTSIKGTPEVYGTIWRVNPSKSSSVFLGSTDDILKTTGAVTKNVGGYEKVLAQEGIRTATTTTRTTPANLFSGSIATGGNILKQDTTTTQQQNLKKTQSPSLLAETTTSQDTKTKNIQTTRITQELKSSQGLKQVTSPAQSLSFETAPALKSAIVSKTAQVLKSSNQKRQVSQSQQTTQKPPKIIPILTPRTTTTAPSKTPAKKKIEAIFEAFGRRKGEDFSLGKFRTKYLAERKLEGFLTGTLGRSGKIKKGDRELSFSELGFGSMFRPSKGSQTRVVQKAKFSLGTKGELFEIQSARKDSKGKKKKKTNWFS